MTYQYSYLPKRINEHDKIRLVIDIALEDIFMEVSTLKTKDLLGLWIPGRNVDRKLTTRVDYFPERYIVDSSRYGLLYGSKIFYALKEICLSLNSEELKYLDLLERYMKIQKHKSTKYRMNQEKLLFLEINEQYSHILVMKGM